MIVLYFPDDSSCLLVGRNAMIFMPLYAQSRPACAFSAFVCRPKKSCHVFYFIVVLVYRTNIGVVVSNNHDDDTDLFEPFSAIMMMRYYRRYVHIPRWCLPRSLSYIELGAFVSPYRRNRPRVFVVDHIAVISYERTEYSVLRTQ